MFGNVKTIKHFSLRKHDLLNPIGFSLNTIGVGGARRQTADDGELPYSERPL